MIQCDFCKSMVNNLYVYQDKKLCKDCLLTETEWMLTCSKCNCLVTELFEYNTLKLCYDCLFKEAKIYE